MSQIIVDIADMKASADPGATLVTYSLGSCLGVTIYDPVAKVGGMAHFMLPLSSLDGEKVAARPFMYVDQGMVRFLETILGMGARKNRCSIKVAGGSQVLDKNDLFRIGQRNFTVLRKVLWKNGLMLESQDVGGDVARTLSLEMATGRVSVKTRGETSEL